MEDFEYSVDISDRDWDCFFKECEECNLLPPSLAGVDDSGMSDIDDTGSILAKRAEKVDLTASLSEADCPIDGPPDCEGSPVEHFLSKHGVGGMESVLSGSEEDIHLQSVNIFFERLKNLTEAEKLPEPSQIKAGKNREAIQEEELCSDGKQASSSTLPKNIPKLNSVPVRGETAGGKETTEPVNTIRNINTMKKVQPASKILHKPAASNSVLKTNMSTSTETELFTREEACTETRANEEMLQNQSPDTPVCSETSPNVDEVIKVKMCTLFRDVKREDMSSSQCNTDPQHDQEIVSNVKWKEEQKPHFLQSNTTRTNKATSQESSPSASVKRKRRKKRQLSTDPAESGNGSDRQRESDEEQYAWRGGRALCLSEDIDLFYLNEPQKNVMSTSVSSVANNFPGMISGNVMRANVSHSIPPCDSQCPATETANSERREKVHAGSLRQPDKKSHNSIMGRENERDLKCCQAEVESITHSILPSADSYDRAVEVIQDDKQSAAKTVLAAEAGNSCRDNHTLCQSEAEPQQQLEIECNHQDRYSCTLGKTHLPLSETGGISSDVSKLPAHNIKSQTEILTRASCARLTSDCINSMSDKSCLCKSPSSLAVNTSVQETEHPLETFSKLDVLPERANLAEVMVVYSGKSFSSGEINLPGNEKERRETTLDTESVVSLSHENSTGMFVSSCSSVSQNNSEGRGEKTSPIMATNGGDEEDATPGPKGQSMSHQTAGSKCDLVFRAEDAFTASKYERKTKTHPVFAMSSFWNEMEKLTINDILGLRMNSKSAAASSLRPLQESEESDMFTGTDSGFCTQQESEQTARHVDMFINPNSLESNSGSVTALDSTSLRDVMWESEPVPVSLAADIYPETMKLTSVSDVSQPCFSGSAQKYLRKISKNVSVHDLHALESEAFSNAWKGQTLQTLDEEESEKVEFFTEGHVPKQDKAANCLPSSSIENYRISLTDIFHYIFGQKQPIPSQSAADNISTCYTDGNSVPETYDHFFSEFDTESFFCPLITAEDQEELAPIFSCSRSKNRNLQFPEAYEYFFASSSSDDSSVESDEDESCSPVRVVTRFTRKPSAAQISTDIYENFFTDSDIKQNFFWKNTFSFRNINFTGATVQKQTSPSPLSLVPMRQSGRSLQRTIRPFNALGNQDMTYPDLLLYRLEDRISRQLAQQPFRHEDLQTAVSNPRLDASLLPFRQSDMCLVCIAFASWVLKTANPQVGDAWKAVLLANVSALSAIQYLRKYVKVESAASEKKLHHLDS